MSAGESRELASVVVPKTTTAAHLMPIQIEICIDPKTVTEIPAVTSQISVQLFPPPQSLDGSAATGPSPAPEF